MKRIIPARAGFTPAGMVSNGASMDHPRSRGVYHLAGKVQGHEGGSSPLARGLPQFLDLEPESLGIIPARAGFTQHISHTLPTHPDHPRSRGVYPRLTVAVSARWGSSPLARGLRILELVGGVGGGIIPARAGFTTRPRRRECGSRGSSPLARGLPGCSPPGRSPSRIIPARAGFTPATPLSLASPPDHPRSRGVYVNTAPNPLILRGSSPLARGLRFATSPTWRCPRIIPARAGFTFIRPRRISSMTDHPRSRGVYWAVATSSAHTWGSSPLARGLPPWNRSRF